MDLFRAIAVSKRFAKQWLQKRDVKVSPVTNTEVEEPSCQYGNFIRQYQMFASLTMQKLLFNRRKIEPFSYSVYATVLFADISGFTRLSARLSAEELKLHINQYFSLLLGIVKENHGDVIKFCGDAVIIMWPIDEYADTETQKATAHLATLCGMQLLLDCGEYDRGEGDHAVSLRIHCGIGTGTVHCMCLGEGDRWEFLISGDPLRQMGKAENEASIGEICISKETYELVQHMFEATKMPLGNYKLTGRIYQKENDNINIPGVIVQPNANGAAPAADLSPAPSTLTNGSSILSKFLTPTGSGRDLMSSSTIQTDTTDTTSMSSSFQMMHSSRRPHRQNWALHAVKYISATIRSISSDKHDESENSYRRRISQNALQPAAKYQVSVRDMRYVFGTVSNPHVKRVISYLLRFSDDPSNHISPNASYDELLLQQELQHNYSARDVQHMSPILRSYVHEAARIAIENNVVSYLAEIRTVTTLFIEILGLDEDFANGEHKRPQRVISSVLACLQRFGGSLRQYIVDDKGCIVIAAFGLPGYSHEDNCTRAIETAVGLRRMLHALRIKCRIGIAQGEVFCGLVGSNERCEYAMMGSSVNLAARLMSKSNIGEIVVNDSVYTSSVDDFIFTALPKIKAKGYARPVAAFIPSERAKSKGLLFSNSSHNIGKFIGREMELTYFERSIENFINSTNPNNSQLHIIDGATGVGKSRLILELKHMILKYPSIENIMIATSTAPHVNSSYYTLRQILDQIFNVDAGGHGDSHMTSILSRNSNNSFRSNFSKANDNVSAEEYLSMILSWCHSNAAGVMIEDLEHKKEYETSGNYTLLQLVPLLSDIISLPYYENEVTLAMTTLQRWHVLDLLVQKILEIGLCNKKNILIVENLQWCDQQSLQILINWLLRVNTGFFIASLRRNVNHSPQNKRKVDLLTTGRQRTGSNDSDTLTDITATPAAATGGTVRNTHNQLISQICQICITTTLHPFSTTEVKVMIESSIGNRLLQQYPDLLNNFNLSQIVLRTAGSPFLTSALTLALRDALITGKYRGIEYLPSGEHNIILNRYDQLSTTDQIVLKTASVIGLSFSCEFLKEVLIELDTSHCAMGLNVTLSQLCDSNLIYFDHDKENYVFTDISVQQSIYNLMLSSQKENAHTMVGLLLEKKFGNHDTHFHAIAQQFFHSNHTIKKIEYLELSAARSRQVFQWNDMYNYLEKLLIIATGLDANNMMSFCCSSGIITNRKYATNIPNSDHSSLSMLDGFDIPVFAVINRWIVKSDMKRNIQLRNLYCEHIALGRYSNKESVKNASGHLKEKKKKVELYETQVLSWIGQMGIAKFKVGNLKMSHNLLIIALHGLNMPVLAPITAYSNTVTNKMYHWMQKFRFLPSYQNNIYTDVITFQQYISKIYLLRGVVKPALGHLLLANRITTLIHSKDESTKITLQSLTSIAELLFQDNNTAKYYLNQINGSMTYSPQANGIRYFCMAIHSATAGEFRDTKHYFDNAGTFFGRLNEDFMKFMSLISSAWYSFISGYPNFAKKVVEEVIVYANMQNSIATLTKWALELHILMKVMTYDISTAELLWEQLKTIRKKDLNNATGSALLAFIYIHNNKYEEAVTYCRYACRRLMDKIITSPISGIFLFLSCYSALSIIEFTGIDNKRAVYRLKESIEQSMLAINKSCSAIPCLRVLHTTLFIFYHRVFNTITKKVLLDIENKISASVVYSQFVFGTAYLFQQREILSKTHELKALQQRNFQRSHSRSENTYTNRSINLQSNDIVADLFRKLGRKTEQPVISNICSAESGESSFYFDESKIDVARRHTTDVHLPPKPAGLSIEPPRRFTDTVAMQRVAISNDYTSRSNHSQSPHMSPPLLTPHMSPAHTPQRSPSQSPNQRSHSPKSANGRMAFLSGTATPNTSGSGHHAPPEVTDSPPDNIPVATTLPKPIPESKISLPEIS